MNCFPGSFINQCGEFIAYSEANEYFILHNCESTLDVKCKVLEWLSRAAFKTTPFGVKKNQAFHNFMLDGINRYLGTSFTHDEMDKIYTYLGNCVNHSKTLRFIENSYDMSILTEPRD
jgi:phenylalanyl-tRNA synthetase beta subunit